MLINYMILSVTIFLFKFARSENNLIWLLYRYYVYVKIISVFNIKYYLYICNIQILILDEDVDLVSARNFTLPFAKRYNKLLIHNNGQQERIHVSVALASYDAADPRNDFSVCRAGTRTRKSYGWSPIGLHDFAPRAFSSLHLIPNKLLFVDSRRTVSNSTGVS